jgi:hypothetical protein
MDAEVDLRCSHDHDRAVARRASNPVAFPFQELNGISCSDILLPLYRKWIPELLLLLSFVMTVGHPVDQNVGQAVLKTAPKTLADQVVDCRQSVN